LRPNDAFGKSGLAGKEWLTAAMFTAVPIHGWSNLDNSMSDDPDRQMTIPELLEARAIIRQRLEMGTGGAPIKGGTWNTSAREMLLAELQEIEAELSEQGHHDAEGP
jgi:hypothetical protein